MIALENLSKNFSGKPAITNINLVFDKRETVVIIGPSGSGKSTLARCINNLENPTTGSVLIDGRKLTRVNREKLCFKIGMVFQQFYLFPHMNVLKNLTYGPINIIKLCKDKSKEKAKTLLKQFGLSHKIYSYPTDLSGGEKQRVAIARALMMDPKIMLLDEPTSALDSEIIQDLIGIISHLKNQMTMIVITHHIKFAKIIADRVIFLDQGEVLADQLAENFFKRPDSHRARLFLKKVGNLI